MSIYSKITAQYYYDLQVLTITFENYLINIKYINNKFTLYQTSNTPVIWKFIYEINLSNSIKERFENIRLMSHNRPYILSEEEAKTMKQNFEKINKIQIFS